MTLRPFSATLQAQFRDTLGTPGAPEVIDDSQPVQAVAVVATVNTASSASYSQITDGTDTLAINGSGNLISELPIPRGSQSVININGTGNGASQNAYTVTTGKTFYLYGYFVQAGFNIAVYLNNGTTKVGDLTTSANSTQCPFTSFCPVGVYTSAQVVKVTASNTATYFLWGVEV